MKKVAEPSQRLCDLLALAGDSQSDLMRKTGIEKSAISNYVKGKRIPRQDKLYLIAKAYNVNPAWLMGLDVEMYETRTNAQQSRVLEYAKRLMNLSERDRETVENLIDILGGKNEHK